MVLALIGIVLTFEEPRKRFVAFFQRRRKKGSEPDEKSAKPVAASAEPPRAIERSDISECKDPSKVPLRELKLGFRLHDRFDILAPEERCLLSFSTFANGVSVAEAARQVALTPDALKKALDRLTSEQLLVVEGRDGEYRWKISAAGRLFLENNPGALWL